MTLLEIIAEKLVGKTLLYTEITVRDRHPARNKTIVGIELGGSPIGDPMFVLHMEDGQRVYIYQDEYVKYKDSSMFDKVKKSDPFWPPAN